MMNKKRVLILGGGITGLSLAWYLRKKHNAIDLTLLEKNTRVGGWLKSDWESGFFFEKGPRTFRTSRSTDLLELISELGLQDQLIFSDPSAEKRFIWFQDQLHALPKNPLAFLFSPLTQKAIPALFKEWKVPPNTNEESIYDFFSRRFNKHVADVLIDPLVLGIFGGDCRALSINSCFPKLKELEQKYGSLTKALFKQQKEKKIKTAAGEKRTLFSLKNGVESLTEALGAQMKQEIRLNYRIKALRFFSDRIEVMTDRGGFIADQVISTLPLSALAELFALHDERLSFLFNEFSSLPLNVVNLGYRKKVLPCSGFGYLIPSKSQEHVMGVVFDSCIFPQQNATLEETRLTAMVRAHGKDPLPAVLNTLKAHLGIIATPDAISSAFLKEALPQYESGHEEKITMIKERLNQKFPRFSILGNFQGGLSVNDCITKSKKEGL